MQYMNFSNDHSPWRRRVTQFENVLRFVYPKTFATLHIIFIIITNVLFFLDLITDCILIHALNEANVSRSWTRFSLIFLLSPWVVLWTIVTHHVTLRNPSKRPISIHFFIMFPFSILTPIIWKLYIDLKVIVDTVLVISCNIIPPFPTREEVMVPTMTRTLDVLTHSSPMLIYQLIIYYSALKSNERTGDLHEKFLLSVCLSATNIVVSMCILMKQAFDNYFQIGFDYLLEVVAGGLSFIPNLKAVESGHSRVINMVGYFLDPVTVFDILKAISDREKELTFIFNHDNFSLAHATLYEYFWKQISEKAQIIYFFKFKVHKDFIRWFNAHDLDSNGTLSKEEFEDIFRWWERVAGIGVDIPLSPLRYAIFREDIVLTEFYVHPYELTWHQKVQFPVVRDIFDRIYKTALTGIDRKEREHITTVTPNTKIEHLSHEASISLIKRKLEWTKAEISHSRIHLSFIIEFRMLRKLTLYECHISIKNMGTFEHRLRELYIKSCYFSHLSALNNFKKLEVLKLDKIEDLTIDCDHLELPSLRILEVSGNGINFNELSVVQRLYGLTILKLVDCDQLSTSRILEPFWFPSLEVLHLAGTKFDRFLLLDGGIPNLRILNLSNCQYLSTEFVEYLQLPQLQELYLNDSNFDQLKILAKLSNLKVLNLQHCNNLKVDPHEVLNFPQLEKLDLSGSRFDHLKVISDLPRLQTLLLMRCERLIAYPETVLNLPALQNLDVRSSSLNLLTLLHDLPVTSLKLARCTKLSSENCKVLFLPNVKRVELYRSNFDRFDLLQGMPMLEVLDMEACMHLDTSRCKTLNFMHLTEINACRSSFDNLGLLNGLPVLQRLNLEGCAQIYCNTEDSLDLPSLEWLCLSESSICHISCLNGLHSLRELYLSGCVHLDAKNIDKLDWPELRELDISRSNWRRVELLTRLLELKVLNLNECLSLDVDRCEEVLDLPRLEELHISGSNFSNLSLFASASKLERLNMRRLTIHDMSYPHSPSSRKMLKKRAGSSSSSKIDENIGLQRKRKNTDI